MAVGTPNEPRFVLEGKGPRAGLGTHFPPLSLHVSASAGFYYLTGHKSTTLHCPRLVGMPASGSLLLRRAVWPTSAVDPDALEVSVGHTIRKARSAGLSELASLMCESWNRFLEWPKRAATLWAAASGPRTER